MPIYDFECKNNHITEIVVSYDKRKKPQVCDECGEPSHYQLSFCTNFQYGSNYSSFAADNHKWNLRENHRKKHMVKNESLTG